MHAGAGILPTGARELRAFVQRVGVGEARVTQLTRVLTFLTSFGTQGGGPPIAVTLAGVQATNPTACRQAQVVGALATEARVAILATICTAHTRFLVLRGHEVVAHALAHMGATADLSTRRARVFSPITPMLRYARISGVLCRHAWITGFACVVTSLARLCLEWSHPARPTLARIFATRAYQRQAQVRS